MHFVPTGHKMRMPTYHSWLLNYTCFEFYVFYATSMLHNWPCYQDFSAFKMLRILHLHIPKDLYT